MCSQDPLSFSKLSIDGQVGVPSKIVLVYLETFNQTQLNRIRALAKHLSNCFLGPKWIDFKFFTNGNNYCETSRAERPKEVLEGKNVILEALGSFLSCVFSDLLHTFHTLLISVGGLELISLLARGNVSWLAPYRPFLDVRERRQTLAGAIFLDRDSFSARFCRAIECHAWVWQAHENGANYSRQLATGPAHEVFVLLTPS